MNAACGTRVAGRESLIRALNLVGDGWSFLILRAAFFRVRRYEAFRETLAIPRTRLSERLGDLVDGGLLKRVPYQEQPLRHEYRLTKMGLDLYGVILMMMAWGDRWRAGRKVVLPLVHRTCGVRLQARLACAACDKALTWADVVGSARGGAVHQSRLRRVRRQLSANAIDRGAHKDSVAATLKVVGDQWTILILHEALMGSKRFDTFQERLGVARNTLALRLGHLVDEGVLEKKLYSDKPARYEYLLSPSGEDVFPILVSLIEWGRRWLFAGRRPALGFRHEACEREARPVVICGACRCLVDPRDVELS